MKSLGINDYDQRAKFYELEFDDISDRTILERLITPEVRRVLEIPCGSGRNCYWLAETGKEVVFGDLSHKMVEIVADKLRRLCFAHKARVERLNMTTFQIPPFDLILIPREGFQMLPREAASATLRNLRRNLSIGGQIYLDVAVTNLSNGIQKDRLPKYIAEQGNEFMLDIESQTKTYSFVRWHRSLYQEGMLHVTFVYEVTESGKTYTYAADFAITNYTPNELIIMALEAGMYVDAIYGDYDLTPLTARSPRILLILKAAL